MSDKPEEQKNPIPRNPNGTFPKGVSGNPAGRVKFSLISILKEELLKYEGDDDKETRARKLIRKYLARAERGDPVLLRDVLNRIDGMPPQKIGFGDEEDSVYEVDVKIRKSKDE